MLLLVEDRTCDSEAEAVEHAVRLWRSGRFARVVRHKERVKAWVRVPNTTRAATRE